MLFFVASGKPTHRIGMPTTGGGSKSDQGMVFAARKHCKLYLLYYNKFPSSQLTFKVQH